MNINRTIFATGIIRSIIYAFAIKALIDCPIMYLLHLNANSYNGKRVRHRCVFYIRSNLGSVRIITIRKSIEINERISFFKKYNKYE